MIWKTIKFNSLYEISEVGDVRNIRTGRPLALHVNRGGYRRAMFNYNGKKTGFTAARLVIEAFVGPRPFEKAEVCHNDGDKLNDCWRNLRWDSHVNNIADKRVHGTWQAGEKHPMAKLTEGDVLKIRQRIEKGESRANIARAYGVTHATIGQIENGKIWRHVA